MNGFNLLQTAGNSWKSLNIGTKEQGFPNSVKGWGITRSVGGIRNFAGRIFLSCGGNLRRSDFVHSNLFQS